MAGSMNTDMNPITISNRIKETYIRFLHTTFPFGKMDQTLSNAFIDILKTEGEKRLFVGPYLEATPPFLKGESLADFSQKSHHSDWKALFQNKICTDTPSNDDMRFPWHRPLWWHQQRALDLDDNNENFVVATGTGSGKTECFLLPVFKYILNNPGKGVKALLIYPMNALVNDQMDRLRRYLKNCPKIKFGYFTGDTPDTKKEALRSISREEYIPNELVSREEIRDNPPDILITNYAMLEYLLLRPSDASIFTISDNTSWKFLVLDEVHTYKGAQGIEIAYLIRRLKERVGRIHGPLKFRVIATSATLTDEEGAEQKIAEFVTQLFGETVSESGIITARTDAILDQSIASDPEKISYSAADYARLPSIDKVVAADKENARGRMLEMLQPLLSKTPEPQASLSRILYDELQNHYALTKLWKLIRKRSKPITELSKAIWGSPDNTGTHLQAIVRLVEYGNYARKAKDELPLFPARYHFMVSGLTGVFVKLNGPDALKPFNKIAMSTADLRESEDELFHPFELAVCQICGQLYITGFAIKDSLTNTTKLMPRRESFFEQIEVQGANSALYFSLEEFSEEQEEVIVCTICGTIGGECTCQKPRKIVLYKAWEARQPNISTDACLRCGSGRKFNSYVTPFRSRQHGTAAVLAEELYRQLPEVPYDALEKIKKSAKYASRFNERDASPIIGQGRKLLIFSDSRQHAAFFGPFLQKTHLDQLNRRIVFEILRDSIYSPVKLNEVAQKFREKIKRLFQNDELHVPLLMDLRPNNNFSNEYFSESDNQLRQANKLLYAEIFSEGRIKGLIGHGMVQLSMDLGQHFLYKDLKDLPLSSEEVASLAQILLWLMMRNGAISTPEGVDPDDIYYSQKPTYYYLDQKPHLGTISLRSFMSQTEKSEETNFEQFIRKWLAQKGKSPDLCRNIINELIRILSQDSVRALTRHKKLLAWQVNHDYLQLQMLHSANPRFVEIPGMSDSPHRCNRCGTWSAFNTNGICLTKNCTGDVERVEHPENYWEDNHYSYIARNRNPIELRSVEHTAQLSRSTAQEYQKAFSCGQLSVLSCSTTFELGVDLGDLNAVFLRNVPPSVANYVQRAGRAGRRNDLVAFVLTFARSMPHDQYYFRNPAQLIAGKIKAPALQLENRKIIYRHFNAIALSHYFRQFPKAFTHIGSNQIPRGPRVAHFFSENTILKNDYGINYLNGCEYFQRWIDDQRDVLSKVFLLTMHQTKINQQKISVLFSDWHNFVINDPEYGLNRLNKYIFETNAFYTEKIDQAHQETEKARYSKDDWAKKKARREEDFWERIQRQLLKDQTLISFLAKNGFLPGFTFPVDVVELKILNDDVGGHSSSKVTVELTRDLKIALSEYAPGSEVIANGRKYKSGAIQKFPVQEFKIEYYRVCPNCENLELDRDKKQLEENNQCRICNDDLDDKNIYSFYVPEWGFSTLRDENPKKLNFRSDGDPQKTYTTNIYALLSEQNEKFNCLTINGERLIEFRTVKGIRLFLANQGENKLGFRICKTCGRMIEDKKKTKHNTPFGHDCQRDLPIDTIHLAHSFDTDIIELRFIREFENVDLKYSNKSFWWSLVYALVEGTSRVLEVERDDLNGVLYPTNHNGLPIQSCLLYDAIPGGAGLVHRLAERVDGKYDLLVQIIMEAKRIVTECDNCNINESCYNCLHHYSNQHKQHLLRRDEVAKYLTALCNQMNQS